MRVRSGLPESRFARSDRPANRVIEFVSQVSATADDFAESLCNSLQERSQLVAEIVRQCKRLEERETASGQMRANGRVYLCGTPLADLRCTDGAGVHGPAGLNVPKMSAPVLVQEYSHFLVPNPPTSAHLDALQCGLIPEHRA